MGAITLLPLDLTGKAVTNRIAGESHSLVTVSASKNRVIMPLHGGFFDANLVVYDASNTVLKKGTDYLTTYLYDDLSELTGEAIYGMIVVTNAKVSAQVKIDYRAVGGQFGLSVREVQAVMDAVADDKLAVKFSDIVGRPTAYIPEEHTHEWWQVIAMYTTIEELKRMRDTIGIGEDALNEMARVYGQALVDECKKVVSDYAKAAALHFNDFNNPHQVTKTQVQLGNLNNWAMATDQQALNSGENSLYLTPGNAYQILAASYIPLLTQHLNDYNNPHQVTAAQLNAYNRAQTQAILNSKLDRNGTAVNSNGYGGLSWDAYYADVRRNIPVGNVNSGRFNVARLGYNAGSYETILMGDSNFRSIRNLFDVYERVSGNSIWFGSFPKGQDPLNVLNASYSDINSFPIGTYAWAQIQFGTAGGIDMYETNYWVRTASGWVGGTGR